jgi:poly(3-hydroxybutyrate) depolymerase
MKCPKLTCRSISYCLTVVVLAATSFARDIDSRKVHCSSGDYRYLVYNPAAGESVAPMPAILLLHGAGDQPENILSAWKNLALKENIVLIAPELPLAPAFEDVAPLVFRCLVEDSKTTASIDPQRIYMFGHSMGGYLAFDAAMLASQYFAAVAVHANRIAEEYVSIVDKASRKTPIALYIGDHDQFFTVKQVERTRDLLLNKKFPIHYVELKGHDHNYYAISDRINQDVWEFLSHQRLPKF